MPVVIDQIETTIEPEPPVRSDQPRPPVRADPREIERILCEQRERLARVQAH